MHFPLNRLLWPALLVCLLLFCGGCVQKQQLLPGLSLPKGAKTIKYSNTYEYDPMQPQQRRGVLVVRSVQFDSDAGWDSVREHFETQLSKRGFVSSATAGIGSAPASPPPSGNADEADVTGGLRRTAAEDEEGSSGEVELADSHLTFVSKDGKVSVKLNNWSGIGEFIKKTGRGMYSVSVSFS